MSLVARQPWLAYTKQFPNHLRAVFVYSLDDRKATQSPTA